LQPHDARSALAAALLDPARALPAGWASRSGSDATRRLAVYRNNVVHSLLAALGDGYPVCRSFIGDDAFDALAAAFVRAHPPHTPVLAEWGAALAGFVPGWGVEADMPRGIALLLADLARLEWARQCAWHAADAAPLEVSVLAAALAQPQALPGVHLRLHPSLQALCFASPAVSVWAAHQQVADGANPDLSRIDPSTAEAAWVLRPADEVLVLPVNPAQAHWATAVQAGASLGETDMSQADLGRTLALLLEHRALCGLHTIQPDA
jgi:hypothetical protein